MVQKKFSSFLPPHSYFFNIQKASHVRLISPPAASLPRYTSSQASFFFRFLSFSSKALLLLSFPTTVCTSFFNIKEKSPIFCSHESLRKHSANSRILHYCSFYFLPGLPFIQEGEKRLLMSSFSVGDCSALRRYAYFRFSVNSPSFISCCLLTSSSSFRKCKYLRDFSGEISNYSNILKNDVKLFLQNTSEENKKKADLKAPEEGKRQNDDKGNSRYEEGTGVVVGVEAHCQLSTDKKLFCDCSAKVYPPEKMNTKENKEDEVNRVQCGVRHVNSQQTGENIASHTNRSIRTMANEHTNILPRNQPHNNNNNSCCICAGEAGALPKYPNEQCIEYAYKTALALQCKHIAEELHFSRKSYFYPDTPKNYQITQHDFPIGREGFVAISGKKVRISRVQLEEDSCKSLQETSNEESFATDLRRSGVPLVEIVSEADMHSAKEAAEYTKELARILQYIGVNDGNLYEGSLRFDVNISLENKNKNETSACNKKVEIKNLNSYKNVAKAIEFESKRLRGLFSQTNEKGDFHENASNETRSWDEKQKVTAPLRKKLKGADYMYIPEPDLPPLRINASSIQKWREEIGEVPSRKRERYIKEYHLSAHDARILTRNAALARYFEEAVHAGADPNEASRLIVNDILGWLGDPKNCHYSMDNIQLTSGKLGELLKAVQKKKISLTFAKGALHELLGSWKGSISHFIELKGNHLHVISDPKEIRRLVEEVLVNNPKAVENHKAGNKKAFGYLMGRLVEVSNRRIDVKIAKDVLTNLLNAVTPADSSSFLGT